TAALAAVPGVERVYSIEGDPTLAAMAVKNLEFAGLKAHIIAGSFEEKLDLTLEKMERVDLVYIDGNHRKDPTLEYVGKIIPFVHNDSVIAIGDIRWSEEMEEAWEEIKDMPRVRTTVELFNTGFVFFKSELANEHFTIKI
ncbi:MAG: class I SAM-dependent methyltransferase, partial [Flavobacteriales bacterium]|nr:class I SAM-dependent methyltransferase [Flavobacteriales bacterium]